MIRTLAAVGAAVFAVGAFGGAPVQCAHGKPDLALRTEDSPGDALYALAMEFRAKGNEDAARATLRYLVEHYPANRHVPAAKQDLAGRADDAPGP